MDFLYFLGPIAQLVEQLTFNQLVPRSSRGRSTIFSSMLIKCFTLLNISLIKLVLRVYENVNSLMMK